jgi:hypothetical protein
MPVRVLHCLATISSGGVEMRHLEIARELRPPHFEHHFLCVDASGPVADALGAAGVGVTRLGPVGSVMHPSRYWAGVKLARRWRPTLVHGAVMEGMVLGAVIGRALRLPVITEETSDPQNRRPWGHRLARLADLSAARCVAVSPAVGRYLTEQLSVPSRRTCRVPGHLARARGRRPVAVAHRGQPVRHQDDRVLRRAAARSRPSAAPRWCCRARRCPRRRSAPTAAGTAPERSRCAAVARRRPAPRARRRWCRDPPAAGDEFLELGETDGLRDRLVVDLDVGDAERDVAPQGVVGEEDHLGHDAEVRLPGPLVLTEVFPSTVTRPAGRRQQAGDDVDQGGLAATRRPADADLLPGSMVRSMPASASRAVRS